VAPGTARAKLPSIVANATSVVLGATTGEQARVWEKPVSAPDFGPPEMLGDAHGQPDSAATSVFLGSDDSLHAVWIDQTEQNSTIRYRTRRPGSGWDTVRTVVGSDQFRPFADVADTALGTIVVGTKTSGSVMRCPPTTAHRGPRQPSPWMRGRARVPDLALRLDGSPALVHAWEDVFVEFWSGSSFLRETIPRASNEDCHADASIAITADGRLVVAARYVAPRVLLAERDAWGTWMTSTPFAEPVAGRVSVAPDPYGGMHLAWASPQGTPPGVRYAYRPPGNPGNRRSWRPSTTFTTVHGSP